MAAPPANSNINTSSFEARTAKLHNFKDEPLNGMTGKQAWETDENTWNTWREAYNQKHQNDAGGFTKLIPGYTQPAKPAAAPEEPAAAAPEQAAAAPEQAKVKKGGGGVKVSWSASLSSGRDPNNSLNRQKVNMQNDMASDQDVNAQKHRQISERDERVVGSEDASKKAAGAAANQAAQLGSSAGGGAAALAGAGAANESFNSNIGNDIQGARERQDKERLTADQQEAGANATRLGAVDTEMQGNKANKEEQNTNERNAKADTIQDEGMERQDELKSFNAEVADAGLDPTKQAAADKLLEQVKAGTMDMATAQKRLKLLSDTRMKNIIAGVMRRY